jgi:hypothetical protein
MVTGFERHHEWWNLPAAAKSRLAMTPRIVSPPSLGIVTEYT